MYQALISTMLNSGRGGNYAKSYAKALYRGSLSWILRRRRRRPSPKADYCALAGALQKLHEQRGRRVWNGNSGDENW